MSSVDSKAASLLISGEIDEDMEMFDSDDCPSDLEPDDSVGNILGTEVKADVGRNVSSGSNYHKMKKVQDRLYQSELLRLAIERNIIICLPTGSGKTYIALKLAEHMLPAAIENRQKIVFLANTVPLVQQQAQYFSANLTNPALSDDKYVRAITGDLNVDIWTQEEWDKVMCNYHILVMSTQILLDAITKAFVKWDQLALLILDECHHAQKSHAMASLMKLYAEKREGKDLAACGLPKVLGLTATIIKGNSKLEAIPKEIKDIEKLLCCRAVTHRNYEEVLKYSTNTTFEIRTYNSSYNQTDEVCQVIVEYVELLEKLPKIGLSDRDISMIQSIDHPSLISEDQLYSKKKGVPRMLITFFKDLLKTYEELGSYCGKMAAVVKMIFILQWIRQVSESSDSESDSSDDDDNYEILDDKDPVDAVVLLENALTVINSFMRNLDTNMKDVALKNGRSESEMEVYFVRSCVSDKIHKLLELLSYKRPMSTVGSSSEIHPDELCGVVFCDRRMTANVLHWYLKKIAELCPEEYGFIRPDVMVGQSTLITDTEAASFSARRQAAVITKFHAKELNLLIATQVVEEGLDVPACNLIIRFDIVQAYTSFVQSMGRARKAGAMCYALVDSMNMDKEKEKLDRYEEFNKKLAEALEENALHVGEDEKDDEDDVVEDIIPPFCPSGDSNGPKITATESISIIHRYCSALSCDKIASLIPVSWWNQIEGKMNGGSLFQASLQLPVLSPVREIVKGKVMPDKTSAKRSVYMEACKLLYYANEFTENLLPKPRSIDNYQCEFLDDLLEDMNIEKLSTVGHKIGSRGRVQQYPKKVPAIIEDSKIIDSDQTVSLYTVKAKIQNYSGDPRAKKLYDFEEQGHYFGIVTNAKFANLPDFTLNANYGTFVVKISNTSDSRIILTKEKISLLQSFQQFLCESVYDIKNPVVTTGSNLLLLAPLIGKATSQTINWELVGKCLDLDEDKLLTEPDMDDRNEIKPASVFENAVLVPWYKNDKSLELLCSLSIMDDTSALSEFDDKKKARTFQEYYAKKYDVQLFHPESPLIVCKSVGKQLNFLTQKVDSKIRRKEINRSVTKVIPELVNIHPLPASLYMQGRLLPSILHRLCRLLVANRLRLDIATYFDWTVEACDKSMMEELSDISSDDDDEDDSNHSLSNMETSQDEVSQFQQLSLSSKQTNSVKGEKICLEALNPFNITWDDLFQETKQKSRYRDNKYRLPGPPTLKSEISLKDIDKIKFNSFDKETDFDKEMGPRMETIMEAITLSNAQDNLSLEKLEVMGDSVLKLLVSIHLFRNFPTWDEGKMTLLRTKLICNLHLYQLGKNRQIGELLSGSLFIPDKNWLPLGMDIPKIFKDYVVSEGYDYSIFARLQRSVIEEMKCMDSTEKFKDIIENVHGILRKSSDHTNYTHSKIGDKSVADAMEAIIGAYYMTGGIDGACRIMEWLGLRAPLEDGSAVVYSRTDTLSPSETKESFRTNKKQNLVPFLNDLEEMIQYKFQNPWLAVEALTHPTFYGNRITPCYERLEFVGDAILDFLVTNYILQNTKITDPGKITDLRAALVNNVTFGSLAVRYGFQKYLKYNSKALSDYIFKFVVYQEANNHEVTDPHKLYSDFDCPTVREIEVPKVLGDVFESIAGAVYVDSGMSIDTTWKVFYRLMEKELVKFSKNIPKNPLRVLHEQYPGKVNFRKHEFESTPKNNKTNNLSKYKIVYLQIPDCDKMIVGIGATVKQAKQAAAKYVVRKLKVGT